MSLRERLFLIDQPSVEVFVFSYQREAYLVECLQSIVSQSYDNMKLVVLDNASDFDVFATVKQAGLEDSLEVVRQDKNVGYAGQFSYVQNNMSAEYVILFHDDDTMPPNMVELLVGAHESGEKLSWVGTNYNLIYDDFLMSAYNTQDLKALEIYGDDIELVNESFRLNKRSGFSSMMYRGRYLKKINLPEIMQTTGDVAIKIELARLAPCAIAYSIFYNVRVHSGQDSYSMSPPFDDDIFLFEIYCSTNKSVQKIRYKMFPYMWIMHRYFVNKHRINYLTFLRYLLKKSVARGVVALVLSPYFMFRVGSRGVVNKIKKHRCRVLKHKETKVA